MLVAREPCCNTSPTGPTRGSRLRAVAWPVAWLTLIAVLSGDAGSYEHSLKVVAEIIGRIWYVPSGRLEGAGWLADALLYIRKPAHVLVYGLLTWSLYKCFEAVTDWPRNRVWVTTLAICLLCGIGDEAHQATVAGRTALPSDVMLDGMASALALLIQRAREDRLRRLVEKL